MLVLLLLLGSSVKADNISDTGGQWTPFLDIVPGQDGTSLYVSAGNGVAIGDDVELYLPTHDKDSWTMVFSPTSGVYVATVTGFTPGIDEKKPLRITSSRGYATGLTELEHIYWPASAMGAMQSADGALEVMVMDPAALPQETYIVIVPSFGPPGPLPPAHAMVGSVYSIRASGARTAADSPLILHMYYTTEMLHGLNPHTLAIFFWDASRQRWQKLGGRLSVDGGYLTISTRSFGAYALMATETWLDEFDDLTGLDLGAGMEGMMWEREGSDWALKLAQSPGAGAVTSLPIRLPEGMLWDSVHFRWTSDPPTTTLRVDILDEEGRELLSHISSGASLAGLDSREHPRLRLRVRMASSAAGASPELKAWGLSWRSQPRIFLPVQLR